MYIHISTPWYVHNKTNVILDSFGSRGKLCVCLCVCVHKDLYIEWQYSYDRRKEKHSSEGKTKYLKWQ